MILENTLRLNQFNLCTYLLDKIINSVNSSIKLLIIKIESQQRSDIT